jgi:hypothetical protein
VDLSPGGYKLRRRADEAAFCHSAGPRSFKSYLHPPRTPSSPRTATGLTVRDAAPTQTTSVRHDGGERYEIAVRDRTITVDSQPTSAVRTC